MPERWIACMLSLSAVLAASCIAPVPGVADEEGLDLGAADGFGGGGCSTEASLAGTVYCDLDLVARDAADISACIVNGGGRACLVDDLERCAFEVAADTPDLGEPCDLDVLYSCLCGRGGAACTARCSESDAGETSEWQVTNDRPEVGVLEAPGGVCTGTLIRQDVVLTAAHCFDFADVPHLEGSFWRSSLRDSQPDRMVYDVPVVAAKVAPSAFAYGAGANDWAVVLLARPIPETVARAAEISSFPARFGDLVTIFGASSHRSTATGSSSRVMWSRTYRWGQGAGGQPGDSGGPNFAADGRLVAVSAGDGLAWSVSTHMWAQDRREAVAAAIESLYAERGAP